MQCMHACRSDACDPGVQAREMAVEPVRDLRHGRDDDERFVALNADQYVFCASIDVVKWDALAL